MARKKIHTERIILRFSPADVARLTRVADATLELRAEMMRDWVLERLPQEERRIVDGRTPRVRQIERVE
jgi:hypothetical protein